MYGCVCMMKSLGTAVSKKKKGIRVHLNLEYTQEMRGEKEFIFLCTSPQHTRTNKIIFTYCKLIKN